MYCQNCGVRQLTAVADLCRACGARIGHVTSQPVSRVTERPAGHDAAVTTILPRRVGAASPRPLAVGSVPISGSERLQQALRDAVMASRELLHDPVDGFNQVLVRQDDRRAGDSGAVLAAFFAFAFTASVLLLQRRILTEVPFLGLFVRASATDGIKVFLLGLVPSMAFALMWVAVRRLSGRELHVGRGVLAGGAALLPLSAFLLLSIVLGLVGTSLVLLLGLAALTYTILLLYGSARIVADLRPVWAAAAVPASLVVAFWLSRLGFELLW